MKERIRYLDSLVLLFLSQSLQLSLIRSVLVRFSLYLLKLVIRFVRATDRGRLSIQARYLLLPFKYIGDYLVHSDLRKARPKSHETYLL